MRFLTFSFLAVCHFDLNLIFFLLYFCLQVLINMAYCCLFLVGKFIQKIVFGDLRISEQQVTILCRIFGG